MIPIPEQDDTLLAQLDMVVQKRKKALLLTPGENLDKIPEGLNTFPVKQGTFVYDPQQVSIKDLWSASENNKIGDVLGYGVSKKPDNPNGVLTVRSASGLEKQAVVTSDQTLQSAIQAARNIQGPTDSIQMENPSSVIAQRDPLMAQAIAAAKGLTVKLSGNGLDYRELLQGKDWSGYQNTTQDPEAYAQSQIGEQNKTADLATAAMGRQDIQKARDFQQQQFYRKELGPVLGQIAESGYESTISPVESLTNGLKAAGLIMAKDVISAGTAVGLPEPTQASQDLLNAHIALHQAKSVGFTGLLGEQVPALVLSYAAPEVAIPTFLASDFGGKMQGMRDLEDQTGTDLNPFTKYTYAIGGALMDMGIFMVGGRMTAKNVMTGEVAEQIGRTFIRDGAKAAFKQLGTHIGVDVAKNVAMMDAAAAVDYSVGSWLGQDRDFLKEMEQATFGGAVFGVTGGVGETFRSATKVGELSKPGVLAQRLIDEGTVTQHESDMVNHDPRAVLQINDARLRGDQVHLDTYEDIGGQQHVMVKTEKDVVPWEMKKAFDHDPVAIDIMRSKIKNGEQVPLFVGRAVGPVGLDEFQGVQKKLETLAGKIKPEDVEVTKDGVPLTKRALLQGDVEFIQQQLETNWHKPDGRRVIEIAKNLLDTANKGKVYDSTLGFPSTPDAIGPRTTILTALDPNPTRLEFIAKRAVDAGLMKPSDKLTDNVKYRGIIDRFKTQLINELSVINGSNRFSAPEAWGLSRKLEETYMDKVRQVLAKDENNSKGTRKQVVKEIIQIAPLEEQPALIDHMDKAITEINRVNSTMTQKETLARLIEDLSGYQGDHVRFRVGTGNTPPHIMEMLQGLYKKMDSGASEYSPWSSKVRKTLAQVNELSQGVLDLVRTGVEGRKKVVEAVQGLPEGVRADLLERAHKAQSAEDFQAILDSTKSKAEEIVRGNDNALIKTLSKKLEGGPRRVEGIELLRTIGLEKIKRAATVVPGVEGLLSDLGLEKPKQAPVLTPRESQRLDLAQDNKAFNAISPQHEKLNTYWNKGVRMGFFSDGEALLLRYLFADVSPKSMEKLTHLGYRNEIQSKEGEGLAAGLHSRGVDGQDNHLSMIEVSRPFDGQSRLHPFIHEFLHNGYYVFLDDAQVQAVETAHAKLLSQPGEHPGESKAHDIIRAISHDNLPDKLVDYYARDPGEFFAEGGSRYILENKASVPVLRKIWDGLRDRLTRYLTPFVADKKASKLLSPEIKDAVNKILQGDRGGQGDSRLDKEIDQGLLQPNEEYSKQAGLKSPIVKDSKTGKEKVDYNALTKILDKLPLDQVQDLKNRLTQLVRHADIEKGLYKKYLKFSQEEDALVSTASLKKGDRNALAQRVDKPLHIAKTLVDPVTMEGWLSQQGGNRQDAPLRSIFHENMVEGMSRHEMNVANTRRFVLGQAEDILGIDAKGVRGQVKLSKYMAQKLENGIRRSEAMWAYALSSDLGRSTDLKELGVKSGGKQYMAEEAMKFLSRRDKEFVDRTKEYFKDNPLVDTAFNRFTLLNGTEPTTYEHWFTSRRAHDLETLTPDFASWTNSFEKQISPLKDRVEHSTEPFDVTGGYMEAFYSVADQMSKYGELSVPSMRAERLINNREFRDKFTEQYGEARLNSLEVYLKHIMGKIGHRAQAWDLAANWINSAWTVGKVGLNVVSALKQGLHIFTMLGDTNLDKDALSKAFAQQAGLNPGVGKRMREGSGLAYNRYDNGRFINAVSLLSEGRGEPSKLKELQHYSMFLQRGMDDYVMRTAWRAAEIMAKDKGLKGQEFTDYVRRKFEVTAGRDQPTDNPLYSGELELYAIRNPIARGALVFMREQNRIYNVMRRNVVNAAQNPTPTNIKNAGYALLFAGVANGVMVGVFNNLRRAAFNKPAFLQEDIQSDAIANIAGMWYLSGEVIPAVEAMFDSSKRYKEGDNLQGPIASTFMNVIKTANAAHDAIASEGMEGKASLISRGINRGDDKVDHFLKQGLDSGIDVISSTLGLPFWGLWYQGKGLYNWTKPEVKMMTLLEVENARLSKQPQANASSLLQIKRIKEQINKVHQRREKGFLSQDEAQDQIANVLRQRYE